MQQSSQIKQSNIEPGTIKAKLTIFDTTMIVVSMVIGIGIFRTPAMVASATQTALLFFVAWSFGGLISLIGALTFAEIGSRFSEPGAFYKVVADCYSSLFAFMLNWTNILFVNGAGAAAVAMIGAEYLAPVLLPPAWQTPLGVQLTAAAMIITLFIINYLGIKTGAWAQNILTLVKVAMILLVVVAAFVFHHPTTATVFQVDSSRPFWLALGIGFISVFYTYGGYQNSINFGADVQHARRNLPRAVFWGISIIIACYLLINFAYFRALGIGGIANANLVAAEVAKLSFGRTGYLFVSLVIFFSAMGFVNVTLLQIPRAYYAIARDRVLPAIFMRVNNKTQVQEFTLSFFVAVILISIFLLGTFEKIVNYVMFLDAFNIAVVASTIFVLRRRKYPQADYSGYKIPFYPFLPAIFVLFLLGISFNVLFTETREARIGLILFFTGLPMFYLLKKVVGK